MVEGASREGYGYNLLEKAVSSVLEDDGFTLPSAPALKARKCALAILSWMHSNQASAVVFACNLIQCLESCFQPCKSLRSGREHMWESYYKFRSSERFVEVWSWAINESGGDPTAIYYQFVTDAIMEELIKQHFPIKSEELESRHDRSGSLDHEEVNALRYCAGYVIRAVKDKLKRSANPIKKELMLCLDDMIELEGIAVPVLHLSHI